MLITLRRIGCLILVCLLAACGGEGFKPQVTGFQVYRLQYGRTAVFYVGGADLRSNMVAETGPACTSPTFASSSTPTTAVLTCAVVAVGELPLTVKSATGEVLYQTTLTVPNPEVMLTTSLGNITVELDPVAAPNTVKNFLTYVYKGYYTDTLIHRVIPGFVIQGGGYLSGMVQKTGQSGPIPLESNNGKTNARGTLAMARSYLPDSATSEFFFNLVDNPALDYQNSSSPGYAVFGRIVDGLSVMDTIGSVNTTSVNSHSNVPVSDIIVSSAAQVK
jgi:peptidyl-prolyl cis-trans isomerase A (cyclophilin A)